MKTITINMMDKNSSRILSESINIENKTKEQIIAARDEVFAEVPFHKWFYEVECMDDLTEEEETMLAEIELEVNM